MINALDSTSTRPYLIRALYEWCTDNGFTPYVAVSVDETVAVPKEYVRNDEIVLNIGFDATSALKLGNDAIEFKARFAGIAREIIVPVGRVMAIYAQENGQGMAFPMASTAGAGESLIARPVNRDLTRLPALASVPDVTRSIHNNDKMNPLVTVSSRSEVDTREPPRPKGGGRPALTRIK